ncbi:MAG: GGDEF domain-containing protein [Atopobiaceae bacterium]|nr:GGDEF domain-containing protein [Atopobiaceae bacterium]
MNRARSDRFIVVLVAVSFLLSTVVSLVSLHVMSQRNVREMNKVLATQVYDHIIGELSEPIMVARTMASDRYLSATLAQEQELGQDATEQGLADYLLGIEKGLGYQVAFVISDASHRYYTSSGVSRVVDPESEHDDWYAKLLGGGEEYDLDVDNDEIDSQYLTVYVNAKIKQDRLVRGICGVGVRMTGVQELFRMLEEDFDVKISLADPSGLVQVDTNPDNIERANLSELIPAVKSRQYEYLEREGTRFAVVKYVESLDWYLIVQSDGAKNASQFANLVLLNAALCAVMLVALVLALRYSRRRTEELTAASLVDQLTMLHNRRAFEQDKGALMERAMPKDLVCVAVDVNGLKTVNDTLGHDAGDELIQGAGLCLKQCLSMYGKVYRTGGDEFAALLHLSEQEQKTVEKNLALKTAAWSGIQVERLSVSCGFAAHREFPQENVLDLCRIADKRMYDEKTRYYERMGISPRRT